MSKTIVLFSQNPKTKGTTTTLPVVGKVTFDAKENCIEINSDQVEELLSRDFGIELLTAEGVKAKFEKVKESKIVEKQTAAVEQSKTVLANHSKYSLLECFEAMKAARSKEDQEYLAVLIAELTSLQAGKKEETVNMLDKLGEDEVNGLLSAYPEKEVKKLNSLTDKIAYLKKQMK